MCRIKQASSTVSSIQDTERSQRRPRLGWVPEEKLRYTVFDVDGRNTVGLVEVNTAVIEYGPGFVCTT